MKSTSALVVIILSHYAVHLQLLVFEMLLKLILHEADVSLLLVGRGWEEMTAWMMNFLWILEAIFKQETH